MKRFGFAIPIAFLLGLLLAYHYSRLRYTEGFRDGINLQDELQAMPVELVKAKRDTLAAELMAKHYRP